MAVVSLCQCLILQQQKKAIILIEIYKLIKVPHNVKVNEKSWQTGPLKCFKVCWLPDFVSQIIALPICIFAGFKQVAYLPNS